MAALPVNNDAIRKVHQYTNEERLAFPEEDDAEISEFTYDYNDSIIANFVIKEQKDLHAHRQLAPQYQKLAPQLMLRYANDIGFWVYYKLYNCLLHIEHILINDISLELQFKYNYMIRIIILSFLCNTEFFYNMMLSETIGPKTIGPEEIRKNQNQFELLFELLCELTLNRLTTNIEPIVVNLVDENPNNNSFNDIFFEMYRNYPDFIQFIIDTHVNHLFNFPIHFNSEGYIPPDLENYLLEANTNMDRIHGYFDKLKRMLAEQVIEAERRRRQQQAAEKLEKRAQQLRAAAAAVMAKIKQQESAAAKTKTETNADKKRRLNTLKRHQRPQYNSSQDSDNNSNSMPPLYSGPSPKVPKMKHSYGGSGGGSRRHRKKLNKLKTKKQHAQRKHNAAIRPTKTRSAPRRLR